MAGSMVDGALVAVLDVLLDAWDGQAEIHGWEIMHRTRRSGPSVYRALDKLEEMGWITASWEELKAGEQRPRLRYYRIVAEKVDLARARTAGHNRPSPRLRPRYGT
ncbi:PadR family transcriptional regulator [Actinoplanes sp. NPDC049668]|uniref:PadR family transcriptional regulator n=1 Tax=unclassified Actinoplanes TaxID=2626549 RepID=UPI0033AE08B7